MESIIPSRYPILRLRKCVLALTVGLAAILLPAAVAFAQLENQDQINRAVKAYEASTKQAVENIPDSEVMKRREDDLDRLSRAKTDADAAQKAAEATADAGKIDKAKAAATKAKELEEAARTLADRARTFETSEADKERAQEYREALEKRRAARLAMKELEAELKPKVDDRRALSADKELDNEIIRLRVRIGRAEQPITSASVAALTPFLPMTANVSTDSQKNCTFGKASPMSVAFEPSDDRWQCAEQTGCTNWKDAIEGGYWPDRRRRSISATPILTRRSRISREKVVQTQRPMPKDPKAPDAEGSGRKVPTKAEATSAPPTGPAASGPPAEALAGSSRDQMDASKPTSPPVAPLPAGPRPNPHINGAEASRRHRAQSVGAKVAEWRSARRRDRSLHQARREALARGDKDSFEFYRRVRLKQCNVGHDKIMIAR